MVENIERSLLIGVAIAHILPHLDVGEVPLQLSYELRGNGVCLGLPTRGEYLKARSATRIRVDAYEDAVATTPIKPIVGSSAPLCKGDIPILGDKPYRPHTLLVAPQDDTEHHITIELPLKELSPVRPLGRPLSRSLPSVPVIK